jgi:F0F1-type ATP synthase beta subunit
MPIGEGIKGRLFNVIGEAIDGLTPLDNFKRYLYSPFCSQI